MGTGAHLCGPEEAMQRSDLSPGFSSGKAGAKDAQLVSPRCGNPFSPQRSLASWLLFGQIRDALRMRPKCCYFAMPHRRRSGLPRRFAPRNDMQKHVPVRNTRACLPMTHRNMRLSATHGHCGLSPLYKMMASSSPNGSPHSGQNFGSLV